MKINKIWLIFVLGLVLRLATFETIYFFWDETNYIMNSQALITGDAPVVQWFIRPPLLSVIILPSMGQSGC